MLDDHPYYSQTIVVSENVQDAIDKAREILQDQNALTIKQQKKIDYDKLFKDPDFGCNPESVYKDGDIPAHKLLTLESKLRKLEWFRPQQIAPDYDMIGFTSSEKIQNISSLEEANQVTGEQMVDGQKIYQGFVEDKWFLNALSMVVVEPSIFKKVNCLDHGTFLEFQNYGLYIFRFFKQTQQVFVIIDDRLACLKDGNGQPLPFFARCENKNLFWVSLIEKAYAKLHHRYWALTGGSTTEALADLAGGLVEQVFMDNGDQMTNSKTLWNVLKTLCREKCLIGARVDYEMFTSMKESTKAKFYAEAEGMGIHRRYIYSILDVREIMAMGEDGKWGKQQLVRIKDPWAGSLEWKGACSDYDRDFWTKDVKASFNAKNALDEDATVDQNLNQRFVHEWNNTNDGVFVMKLTDFMKFYNNLTFCRQLPAEFVEFKYLQSVEKSQGAFNIKNQEWLENNQFIYLFDNPTVKTCRVMVQMEQEDVRMTKADKHNPPFNSVRTKIGFVIIEMSKQQDSLTHFEAKRLIKLVKPQPIRICSTFFEASNLKYCIIPFTEKRGETCNFSMKVHFQSLDKYVKLGKPHAKDCMMTQIPGNQEMDKWKKLNSILAQVLLPYNVDTYINKRDAKPNKNKESIAENVRLLFQSEAVFEDEAMGMPGSAITSEEFALLDQETIQQILLGVDLDEVEEEEARKKRMDERDLEDLRNYKEQIKEDTKLSLDLAYYHIGNEGLVALIPTLERDYLLNVKQLDISYNSLNDAGLEPLVQSLAALGSPIEELNISGNNLSDGICRLLADKIREGKCRFLAKVIVEDCKNVSDEGKRSLKIAQMKAQGAKGNDAIHQMANAAKRRDQMELAEAGVKFADDKFD